MIKLTAPIFVLFVIPTLVSADYDCICNQHSERDVYKQPGITTSIVNNLYQGDCLPLVPVTSLPENWVAVAINNEVAYILKDYKVTNESCPGDSGPLPTLSPPGSQTTTARSLATTTSSTPQHTTTTKQVPTTPPQASPTTTASSLATATTQTQTTTTSTPQPTTTSKQVTTSPAPGSPTTTASSKATTTTHTQTTTTSTPQPKTTAKHATCYPQLPRLLTSRYMEGDQSCYEFVNGRRNWNDAEADCRSQGGFLVTIDNVNEQELVHRAATLLFNLDVWIGLNDIHYEGHYTWVSGISPTYNNFGITVSHITVSHALHDCVIMRRQDGKWDDTHCVHEHLPYVCEYAGHNNPGGFVLIG